MNEKKEFEKNVGKTAYVEVQGLKFEVKIKGVECYYGNKYFYLVEPVRGEGSKRFSPKNIILK